MNKIVYVSQYPLTAQIRRFTLLDELMAAGFEVEYWDLSPVYSGDFYFENVESETYVKKMGSLRELGEHLKREDLKKTAFNVQTYLSWGTLPLFLIFTRFGCVMFFMSLIITPARTLTKRIVEKISYPFFVAVSFGGLLNLFAKICRKSGFVKNYDLVFAAGKLSGDAFREYSRVVDVNYVDYDHYVELKNAKERVVLGDYCVFLDEGSINNQDIKIAQYGFLDPEVFYRQLNRFFDHIEQTNKIKVVIAAHPGIYYGPDVFAEREVYEGKTCELVKDCTFVISQASMSVSYAALYRKPVIFISTDEYIASRKESMQMMTFFSGILGLKIVNISRIGPEAARIPDLNPDAYDDFKYMYLTSKGSEDLRSRDIVVKTLKELT